LQSCGGGRTTWHERHHFEERPHFFGVRQAAMCGDMAFKRRASEVLGESLRAGGYSKTLQKHALGREGRMRGGLCRLCERFKVNVGCKIG